MLLYDFFINISELQKSGKTKGEADNFKNVLEKYKASALCLKTMAAEILKLPPIEPSTPFDGKITLATQRCSTKLVK